LANKLPLILVNYLDGETQKRRSTGKEADKQVTVIVINALCRTNRRFKTSIRRLAFWSLRRLLCAFALLEIKEFQQKSR